MTLPTGMITMGQLNTELQRTATQPISLNDGQVRIIAGLNSGLISMNSLRGKSWVTFDQPEGYLYAQGMNSAGLTITCNRDAVWTYTSSGVISISPATGGTSKTFSASVTVSRSQERTSTASVTATAFGVSRTWQLEIYAYGSGISPS